MNRPPLLERAEGPGGMAVVLLKRPGFAERLALLGAGYGSTDLVLPSGRRTPPGVAHFLEHVLFETAEGNASDLFSARGASSNAFTDYAATAYLFSAPDRWRENLGLLLSFVTRPPFPPEKVEKERGIILQEVRMYLDSPGSRLSENLHQALFRRHPARLDIAGTVASVKAIRRHDLLACHGAFYRPSNLCLVASGDLGMRELLDIVREKVPARRQARPRHLLPAEPPLPAKRRISRRMEVSQPQLLMGFKDPDPVARGDALLDRRIAAGLCLALLFEPSAELHRELYESGLIDDDFSSGYASERGFAYAAVGGQTRDPRRLERLVLKGIAKAVFRETDLRRAKRKALGHWIRMTDSSQALASAALAAHFQGVDLEGYPARLAACGLAEVEAVREGLLRPGRMAVSVLLPKP